MPQLLLEILSEEIPARMQAKAEADLVKALMDGLSAAGLLPEGIKGFSGPRRLVAVVEGLPVKSADVVEDVIGPKEGAPDAAKALADRLAKQYNLRWEPLSKFARANALK